MSLDRETITHASCLRGSDVARLGVSGLRARPMRAILSALGIAIGIAAMVGVVGVSASSQARLHEQLQALGTNMLTARSGADPSRRLSGTHADDSGSNRCFLDVHFVRSFGVPLAFD